MNFSTLPPLSPADRQKVSDIIAEQNRAQEAQASNPAEGTNGDDLLTQALSLSASPSSPTSPSTDSYSPSSASEEVASKEKTINDDKDDDVDTDKKDSKDSDDDKEESGLSGLLSKFMKGIKKEEDAAEQARLAPYIAEQQRIETQNKGLAALTQGATLSQLSSAMTNGVSSQDAAEKAVRSALGTGTVALQAEEGSTESYMQVGQQQTQQSMPIMMMQQPGQFNMTG